MRFNPGGIKKLLGVVDTDGNVDARGNTLVSASMRYIRAVNPAASPLPDGPCDALLLSVDANVTVLAEEDSATILLPLKGGVWHPVCAIQVTVVSTGSVYAGYFRKPL